MKTPRDVDQKNPFLQLRERLGQRFPTASLAVDKPETRTGSWWLDIAHEGQALVVEWRPSKGFGISSPDASYGTGPDEVYADVDAAYDRIVALLLSQTRTIPPEIHLSELRELKDLSQVALANRLNISQAALSKLERRADIRVGTLRKLIEAMGGKLELRASFAEFCVPIVLDEKGDPDAGAERVQGSSP